LRYCFALCALHFALIYVPDLLAEQIEQTKLRERELAEKRNKAKQAATTTSSTIESQNAVNNPNQDQEQPIQDSPTTTSPKTGFPMGIFILALGFDAVGWIPYVNFVTEPTAAVIFGYWQKKYQNTDYLTVLANIAIWKGIDVFTAGIFPSNSGLVIKAYIKKKVQNVV